MPEAPEVYSYYLFIYPLLINKCLSNINILSGKYLKNPPKKMDQIVNNSSSKIKEITVHGKLIFIRLENNCILEFSHGMTGVWSTKLAKYSRIELVLNGKERLYFEDTRNFARLNIYDETEYKSKMEQLGPNVLDIYADFTDFYKRIIKRKNSNISTLLLDQTILSGIGNYLRCDILWYTKINHYTKVKDIPYEKLMELFKTSIEMTRFYAKLDNNLKKHPINDTFVYMQKYDIYGNKVCKKKFGSRTIHFVEFI